MTTRRSTGSRQTAVRRADPRVVGLYEPMPSEPSDDSEQMVCTGRVGTERSFDYTSLLQSSCHLTGGRFGVPMIDVLAAVGLDRSADVVVFSDGDDQLAVPVRDLMHGGALVPSSVSGLVLLDVPGWTDDELQIVPRSMCAVSFSEFVQCQ